MNISKPEQRVLHALAQGGAILVTRTGRKISDMHCVTRDGMTLTELTPALFARLRRRGLIASTGGGPYRISMLGRQSVRAQLDNR